MITRRTFLSAAAGVAVAAAPARAQATYPDKVIKMIVPAPAGGQTDVLARLLAQKIQAAVGQNVIIDNRPGAGGALGARALAAAEPDGYTLFYGNTSHAGGDPGGLQESRLRSGEELRPDRERLRQLHDPGGAPVVPGEDGPGVRGLRQGQSRQAQLRARRRRQRHPSDRRDVPLAGQDRVPRRAATGAAPNRSPACWASRSISCSRARWCCCR